MEHHLIWLLDQLEPSAGAIRRLREDYEVDASFLCGYFMGRWNSGLLLSAATLQRLAAFAASLGFDIYGADQDD